MSALLLGLARHSWRARRSISFTSTTELGGRILRVPVRNGLGLHHAAGGVTEPWMVSTLKLTLTRQPGILIDVGANDGGTLLNMLRACPSARYVGFEPLPEEYAYVQALIEANELDGARIFPVALSDSTGITALRVANDHSSSSIRANFRPPEFYSREVPVLVMRGDDFMNELRPGAISTIKIDVEGAESMVLRGFSDTIKNHRPYIVFELLPYHTDEERVSADDVATLLRKWGYRVSKISLDGSLEEVREIGRRLPEGYVGTKADWDDSNYLASPL